MPLDAEIQGLIAALDTIPRHRVGGFVTACGRGTVTASGLAGRAGVGDVCLIERRPANSSARSPLFDVSAAIRAEIVGFGDAGVQLVPYDEPSGIGHGARVALAVGQGMVRPSLHWRGRVLDEVLCLMDSVTRFAMALREIHLAAGEVPTSRGYPPGVFAELPRLLERAGPGRGDGSITGLFTVLVEGDDANEPVSDAVRGILDGHIMLDRAVAERGRFPAVDVLCSISRTAPGCYHQEERSLVREARRLMRLHADMADLIRLGAYRAGSDADLDRAIAVHPALERVLEQDASERSTSGEAFAGLAAALATIDAGAV